jgi:hypothetical protein
VIAFSDAGLAHLAIGASRIPRSRRKRWLADIARWVEQGEPPKPLGCSTLRMRDLRARAAAGKVRLEIVIDEIALVVKLTGRGLLDPSLADDKSHLARAVERYLSDASPQENLIFDTVRIGLLALALQRKRKSRGRKLSPATAARPCAQD